MKRLDLSKSWWIIDSGITSKCVTQCRLGISCHWSDTNVTASFSTCLQIGHCWPLALEWLWPGTQLYLKALINRLGVGGVARVCVKLKNAWRAQIALAQLKEIERAVLYNAEGKHCSNSTRPNEGSQKRGEKVQFAVRAYEAILPPIPSEGAEKDMNLRNQFAEFCSIDRSPGSFTGWRWSDFRGRECSLCLTFGLKRDRPRAERLKSRVIHVRSRERTQYYLPV